MEQHHARSCAITTLEEVETQPLTLDEIADWWVLPFSDEREHDVPYDQKNEEDSNNDESGFTSGHSRSLATQVASRIAAEERANERINLHMLLSFLSDNGDRGKD